MTIEEIRDKIRTFLSKFIKNKEIDDDFDLFGSKLLNSMFAMQMVMFVEKEFKIKVENKDLKIDNFKSINALKSFVSGKL